MKALPLFALTILAACEYPIEYAQSTEHITCDVPDDYAAATKIAFDEIESRGYRVVFKDPGDSWGITRAFRHVVEIHPDLEPETMAGVAWHELTHVRQFKDGMWAHTSKEWRWAMELVANRQSAITLTRIGWDPDHAYDRALKSLQLSGFSPSPYHDSVAEEVLYDAAYLDCEEGL